MSIGTNKMSMIRVVIVMRDSSTPDKVLSDTVDRIAGHESGQFAHVDVTFSAQQVARDVMELKGNSVVIYYHPYGRLFEVERFWIQEACAQARRRSIALDLVFLCIDPTDETIGSLQEIRSSREFEDGLVSTGSAAADKERVAMNRTMIIPVDTDKHQDTCAVISDVLYRYTTSTQYESPCK